MNINKVIVRNFKGIEKMEFVPQKINVFVGPNGAGKSSALQSIIAGLTGECTNPIRTGAKEAYVKLDMGTLGSDLERVYGAKNTVKIAGKVSTQKAINQLFEDRCKVSNSTMKLMTSSKLAAEIKAGTLADFMLKENLFGGKLEISSEKLFSMVAFSADAKKELEMFLPATPATFGMDVIADTHKEFYDMRTVVKRDMITAKAKSAFTGVAPTRKAAAIEKEIEKLSDASGKMKEYQVKLEFYEKQMNIIREKTKALEKSNAEVSALKSVTKPDESRKVLIDKQVEVIRNNISSNGSSKKLFESNLAMLNKTLANLEKPVCPLSDKLVCSTDKTPLKKELSEQAEGIKAEISRLESDIQSLNEKLEKGKAALLAYDRELKAFNDAQGVLMRHKMLKESIPETPEKPELPSEVADATKRLQELKEEKEKAVEYELAQKNAMEVIRLEGKYAVYNEIVSKLDSKGEVNAAILKSALEILKRHINSRAKEISSEFEIDFDVTNGVRFLCKTSATSGFINISDASSGEQLMFMFLIMDMLNSASGFGLFFIDDLDKLDENMLEALIKLLLNPDVSKVYHHTFISAINHEDTMKVLDKYSSEVNVISL